MLWRDARPPERERHLPAYERLLAELGIASPADLQRRCAEVAAFLPELRRLAEAIMAANPEISA